MARSNVRVTEEVSGNGILISNVDYRRPFCGGGVMQLFR